LLGLLAQLDCPPTLSARIIPLCMTHDNCRHVISEVSEKLGPSHLVALEIANRIMNLNDLEPEENFPADRHYIVDDHVDPMFSQGLAALAEFIRISGSLDHFS
jgi:hypothetical protein